MLRATIDNNTYMKYCRATLFFFLAVMFCAANAQSQQSCNCVAIYHKGNQSLSFFDNGTYELIQHNSDIYYPDIPLLSKGKFVRYKDYAYYLFSDTLYSSRPIRLLGKERNISTNKYQIEITDTFRNNHAWVIPDDITGIFLPVKKYYYDIRLYYDYESMYYYRLENPTVDLQSMGFQQLSPGVFFEETISYNNYIEIAQKIPVPIQKISIRILPYGDVFEEYFVQDTSSNNFAIEIPSAAYIQMDFLEFDGEIAEIIDDNAIGFLNDTWYKAPYAHGKKVNKRLRRIWQQRYRISNPYNDAF